MKIYFAILQIKRCIQINRQHIFQGKRIYKYWKGGQKMIMYINDTLTKKMNTVHS